MSTRLYIGRNAGIVSPTPDASWEVATPVRRNLELAKGFIGYDTGTLAGAEFTTANVATSSNTPAGAVDVVVLQMISPRLNGNQTISGAIKGQVRAFESNAAADLRVQCVIRVMDSAGSTVRGTLVASDTAALSHELNTALRNIAFPRGAPVTPTSVNALDTDRIVVELGYRKHESATTARSMTIEYGLPSGVSDLPEDETTTTQLVGWIEFADTLVFYDPVARITQQSEMVLHDAVPKARLTQQSIMVLQPRVQLFNQVLWIDDAEEQ